MKLKPTFLALFALSIAIGPLAIDRALAQQFAVNPTEMQILISSMTNRYRKANGLGELKLGSEMAPIAQEYAEFLARTNTMGHTTDGRDPAQRVADHGIKNCGVWENVFEYWSAPSIAPLEMVAGEAIESWRQSHVHRENLLRAQATHVLVGAAGWTHDGKNYYKVVQVLIDDCNRQFSP
jgi:uncharacterized protein YkwD